ncbi:hypothetical protein Ancab_021666, partial [Ancistrocladus abbreviatus]
NLRQWTPAEVSSERMVWLRCCGVPLHTWNFAFFVRMASIWGSFILLDGATSGKKCFDVPGCLFPPVPQDLSQGLFQSWWMASGSVLRCLKKHQAKQSSRRDLTVIECQLTVWKGNQIQTRSEETRGGGKSTSLANITSSGEMVFLNTPDSMDDRHGCRSPLGKSYCTEPVAIKIIKHFLVEPPLARYVSCSTDKDGGALMETQIGTIKRREEKATHFPFSVFQKPADNLTLELIGIGSGEGGPCVLKARRNLGESGLGQATEKEIKSPKGPAKRLELAKVKPRSSNV